jgi:6-phosphogluconolactonase
LKKKPRKSSTAVRCKPIKAKRDTPHWAGFSTNNKYAFVCDLGLDKILIYKFDESNGDLKPNDPPYVKLNDGSGPRHLSFHPNEKFAFVINELDSTITAIEYNNGSFKKLNSVKTLPTDFTGQNATAEIEVHPNGRFIYGSNRGHDSIVCFEFFPDKKNFQLIQTISSGGNVPRSFAITLMEITLLQQTRQQITSLFLKLIVILEH